ncbi:MAG: hypothetical protein U0559_15230 [Anaerolineae bacterium]
MSSLTAALPVHRLRTLRPRFIGLFALVLLIGVAGWRLWASAPAALPGQPASEAAIADKWGIRVTHIAVLADGGLIDFRFQVIDPDKASPLFELASRPIMYVESTGQKVDSLYHPPHGHNIVAGQSQYFIYNNQFGAIKSGAAVAVVLGDLRLEHVIAK